MAQANTFEVTAEGTIFCPRGQGLYSSTTPLVNFIVIFFAYVNLLIILTVHQVLTTQFIQLLTRP